VTSRSGPARERVGLAAVVLTAVFLVWIQVERGKTPTAVTALLGGAALLSALVLNRVGRERWAFARVEYRHLSDTLARSIGPVRHGQHLVAYAVSRGEPLGVLAMFDPDHTADGDGRGSWTERRWSWLQSSSTRRLSLRLRCAWVGICSMTCSMAISVRPQRQSW
jgi:hypothetical protein